MFRKIITTSLFIVLAAYNTCPAFADTITEVGYDGVFGCLEDEDTGETSLIKVKDGLNTPVSFGKTIKKTRKKIRVFRKNRRLAQQQGKIKKVERLENKIDRFVNRLGGILVCRDGEGSAGGGSTGGSGGGGSGGGGEGGGEGGGGGEESVVACDVVGEQSSGDEDDRIINGQVCSVGNSYTVEINISNGSGGFLCSGTVVTSRGVITAAHCLDGMTSAQVVTSGGTFSATSFAAHPNWTGSNFPLEKNDVGVIVVGEDLPTAIAPVHGTGEYVSDEVTVIGGYGKDDNGNTGTLRAATALLDSSTSASVTITYSGSDEHGNTCSGDSGGPLFIKRDGVWKLAAVTSNGVNANCGSGDISNFANLEDPSNQSFIEGYIPGLFD
jgi:hypothetical protein